MTRKKSGVETHVNLSNVGTTTVIGSATAQPAIKLPGNITDPVPSDGSGISLDEVATIAAKLASARAEQLINERLSSANQAQIGRASCRERVL